MSYANERRAIESYFAAQWADQAPVIWDGQGGEPATDSEGVPLDSVRLTIQSGAVLQGSIGRDQNRMDHVGMVTVAIYTAGGAGSAAWRGYAETITDLFHGITLDPAGAPITQTADAFVRFSPPQLGERRHPYIAASFADAPFHITNVIAPFVRYSLK